LNDKIKAMAEEKTFSANDASKLWQLVKSDMATRGDFLQYDVSLELPASKTLLTIDIDLGGGFQGGISTTTFKAHLSAVPAFRFAIHDETFMDEIGKFFGMQDVIIGYPEFDDLLIIKTDNEEMTRLMFSEPDTRKTIQSLTNFSLFVEHTEGSPSSLHLIINEGITAAEKLEELHSAFLSVLTNLKKI
jgi:hypothetical protein